jgi:hypothetical protein
MPFFKSSTGLQINGGACYDVAGDINVHSTVLDSGLEEERQRDPSLTLESDWRHGKLYFDSKMPLRARIMHLARPHCESHLRCGPYSRPGAEDPPRLMYPCLFRLHLPCPARQHSGPYSRKESPEVAIWPPSP